LIDQAEAILKEEDAVAAVTSVIRAAATPRRSHKRCSRPIRIPQFSAGAPELAMWETAQNAWYGLSLGVLPRHLGRWLVFLDAHERHRRRIMLTSESGTQFLLDLPRAAGLRDGDGLVLEDGLR
jgi:hypothetical protein